MLTEFGIEIRKVRLEKHIRLKDMADQLGTSSAYLSAVETGRKPIPTGLVDEIVRELQLDEDTAARLRRAALKSIRSVRLEVHDRDEEAQELAATFARRFPTMDDNEVQRVMRALTSTRTDGPDRPSARKKK